EDGEAGGDHDIGLPGDADQFGQLRHENQDGERVDEAGQHRAGDEFHDGADAQIAGADLQDAGQNGGGEQILQAMLAHQAAHQDSGGGGGGRDHRRPAPGDGNHHGDNDGGIEADFGIDPGNDGKADGLGNQGK